MTSPGIDTSGLSQASPGRPRLWSAKKRVVLKRPPLPGDTHDVSRQAQTSSRRGTRLASRACSHSPEPRPGWVPASQDLMTNEAGPVVMDYPLCDRHLQMAFVDRDQEVEALAPQASTQPFTDCVGPGRPNRSSKNCGSRKFWNIISGDVCRCRDFPISGFAWGFDCSLPREICSADVFWTSDDQVEGMSTVWGHSSPAGAS